MAAVVAAGMLAGGTATAFAAIPAPSPTVFAASSDGRGGDHHGSNNNNGGSARIHSSGQQQSPRGNSPRYSNDNTTSTRQDSISHASATIDPASGTGNHVRSSAHNNSNATSSVTGAGSSETRSARMQTTAVLPPPRRLVTITMFTAMRTTALRPCP